MRLAIIGVLAVLAVAGVAAPRHAPGQAAGAEQFADQKETFVHDWATRLGRLDGRIARLKEALLTVDDNALRVAAQRLIEQRAQLEEAILRAREVTPETWELTRAGVELGLERVEQAYDAIAAREPGGWL